jgi:hypothetical protein
MSNKSELLEEIIRIDRTIMGLNKDRELIKIRKNIRKMEHPTYGKRSIKILSPDDFETELIIRKKTKKWKIIKKKYKNMKQEYEDTILSLHKKRSELENQIFSG